MLFEINQMEMYQHQMTFENSHLHQNRNSIQIKQKLCLFVCFFKFYFILLDFDEVLLWYQLVVVEQYPLDLFVENFVHILELISHVIYYFYILDMLDYLHEFQAIDIYMANKINDRKEIKQHHELFLNKSTYIKFF